MPTGSPELDQNDQNQHQDALHRPDGEMGPQEALNPEVKQVLEGAGAEPAKLASAIQKHPEAKSESLEWVEANHGLAARSQIMQMLELNRRKRGTAMYTVQPGDSLSAIAREVLGDPNRWREIFELNKETVANPNAIQVGQQLALPSAQAEGPNAAAVEQAVQNAAGGSEQAPETSVRPQARPEPVRPKPRPEGLGNNAGPDSKPDSDPNAGSQSAGADNANAEKSTAPKPEESKESEQGSQTAQVTAQFGTFAQGVAQKTKDAVGDDLANAGDQKQEPQLGQAAPERYEERGPLGQKDRKLYSHSDPLLGNFDVILNLDGNMGASASPDKLVISSDGGLLVRTPKGMSDIRLRRIELDLKTQAVTVDSQPDIGPLEEKILQGVLRETLLSQVPQLMEQGKSPVANAMEGLPSTKDGKPIAWQYKDPLFGTPVIQLVFPNNPQTGIHFNSSKIDITISPFAEMRWPGIDLQIAAFEYHFADGRFEIRQEEAGGKLAQVANWLWQPALEGIEWAGAKYFKGKLPAAMKEAGYDPTTDPDLQKNLNELYTNFTGMPMAGEDGQQNQQPGQQAPESGGTSGGEAASGAPGQTTGPAPQTAAGPASGSSAAEQGAAEKSHQTLYRLQTEKFGEVEVCLDKDDAATIYKDAKQVGLDTRNGIFLKVPGKDWVEDIRLRGVRFDLETGEIDIQASEKVGEFVDAILEDLVRAYVLPQLPGEAAQGLGVGGLEGNDTHQVLYSADAPQVGKVDVMLEKTDRLELTKSAEAIEMSASQGLIIRAAGFPALSELRLQRIHYSTVDGHITIDSDRDVGPLVEKVISQVMRHAVVPQLPGGLEGLGLKGASEKDQVDPKKLERYPNTIFSYNTGMAGNVELRLAASDTLGVGADDDTMRVYGTQGIMLYAPSLGIDLTFQELTFNYVTGEVGIVSELPLGQFEKDLLQGIAKDMVLPMVKEHYQRPEQDPNADHSVLYSYEGNGMKADIALDKGDELRVQKSDKSIELITTNGLSIISEAPGLPANVRLHRVYLDLESGEIVIDSKPDIGPLGETIATKAVRALVFPHLPPELAKVGITAPDHDAEKDASQESLPKKESLELYSGEIPQVGPFDVSISGRDQMEVNASANSLKFESAVGILVRVPGLDLAVRITAMELNLVSGEVSVKSSTQLGEFEKQVITNLFKEYGQPMLAQYVRDPKKAQDNPGFDVLYEYSDEKLGNFAVATGKGGSVSVKKTDHHLELVAPQGMFVQGLDWLPNFELTRIHYELGTGKFEIDVGGVQQGHYREGQDVGAVTEDVVSQLVKAMVGPHLPPQAKELGIVGMEEETQGSGPPGTMLHQTEAPGAGKVEILLQRGDSLSVAATEQEAMVSTAKGLIVNLPDLNTSARIRYVKYHFRTGEIQVDGLGALENAMIEAALVEFVTPLLPKEMQTPTPVGTAIDNLPRDRKGRRQLMESDAVDLYLENNTRFDVTLTGSGLHFQAHPGLRVDSYSALNYQLKKIDFSFARGKFEVDTKGDNIIAGIFNGAARGKAEKALNEMLIPLMPEEMLRPGYDMTNDPDLAGKIAHIVENFGNVNGASKDKPAQPKKERKPRFGGPRRRFR